MPLAAWEHVLLSRSTYSPETNITMAARNNEEREYSPEIITPSQYLVENLQDVAIDGEQEDDNDIMVVDEADEKQGEEFFVPDAKDDLISKEDSPFFIVSPYSLDEIAVVFGDDGGLENKIREQGLKVFTDEFASVASTLWHFKFMTTEFFQGMLNGFVAAVNLVIDRCHRMQDATPQAKLTFRSNFKISFYHMCQFLEQLGKQIHQSNASAMAKKGGQKFRIENWMQKLRFRALTSLANYTDPSRNWKGIWEKKKIDTEISRLLLTTLLRFCEDVNIASSKSDVQAESELATKALANAISSFHLTDDFLTGLLKLFHRHDASGWIAADVIGRVCQLHSITELAEKSCITKRKYRIIFEKVLSRSGFGEKTQTVRKAALQCLTALTEIAPEVLENSLEKMMHKLVRDGDLLAQKLPDEIGQDFTKNWIVHSNWLRIQKSVVKTMRAYLASRTTPAHVEEALDGKRFESVMDYISAAIEKMDGETAVYGLLYAAEKFPEKKLIMDYHVQSFLSEFDNDAPPYRMLSLLDCLRDVLNWKDQKERKGVKRIDALLKVLPRDMDDETRTMVSEFRLLQDDIAVRAALTRAIPTWEKVLQMSNKSDIVEISTFLIKIERKGFKEAVYILRGLTNFFASESKEIREAVMGAYREFFIGENADALLANVDPLVNKLMRELPCNSALSFHAVRLLFKNEDERIVKKAARKLMSAAVTSDGNDDVWRACLALSILPGAADKVIMEQLENLYPRCLQKDGYDPRLVCTFCDVLVKAGKSPLAKEDITEKETRKMSLDVLHPIFLALLDICLMSFADSKGFAQTQMYGKIAEALFAISEDPKSTMKHLMYFTIMRLKMNLSKLKAKHNAAAIPAQTGEPESSMEGSAAETDHGLLELQYILYFGATVVFVFGNWIEDIFSVSQDSKGKPQENAGQGETNENEVDGPSEDDRSKAVVLQIRKALFECSEDGHGSAVYRISRIIVQLAHTEAVITGNIGGVVTFMALIRLMLVSEHFCKAHMRYLLKVLESTKSLELKKVLLIGFSDIAVRFVNLIQPYTDSFTNQLRDPNPSIRYHALMAVVRLIVNDLVKIRGQQCDIAMLICDSDEKVSKVSRGFFSEKVPKQNVMGMIPELINRADLYTKLDQSHVEELLKYLIGLAGKTPTDMETLADAFLEILTASRPARTWQIAAYGLTVVGPQVAEKFAATFRDQISSLKKALKDEIVFTFVNDMMQSLRKKLPDDKKRLADDLLKMIQAIKGDPSRRQNRSPQPSTSRQEDSVEEDDSEGSDSNSENDDHRPVAKHAKRGRKQRGTSVFQPKRSPAKRLGTAQRGNTSPQKRRFRR
ncbi:condensin complex subunit 1-like [Paramacrobiotus metropolitanus]|uniref:condensin complex subunit 1-like n=1 Tax=Paramacrobiotus metropolitanus TaxID=2943436 RepID=UPI0024459B57|nr:condensin complex subunit 1-like [Paramacrobiotus metropolitanus]